MTPIDLPVTCSWSDSPDLITPVVSSEFNVCHPIFVDWFGVGHKLDSDRPVDSPTNNQSVLGELCTKLHQSIIAMKLVTKGGSCKKEVYGKK